MDKIERLEAELAKEKEKEESKKRAKLLKTISFLEGKNIKTYFNYAKYNLC